MASFLDGRLSGAQREHAIAHLAGCDSCRNEVAELRAMIESTPVAPRRGILTIAGMAAVLLFVIVPRLSRTAGNVDGIAVTRSENVPTASIEALTPPDHGVLSPVGAVLTWRPVGFGATYRLTIQDSAGGVVWSKMLSDTTQLLPDSVRLKSGSSYFWAVEAQLANGHTARTEDRTFTVR